MAIPEYPITRREQYLDAIATNDTSVLPAEPITRTEQYLDAIARNGGGGSGGGGSGGGGGVLVVNATDSGGILTLDKTAAELESFISGGGFVLVYVPNEDDGYNILRQSAWFPYSAEYGYAYKFYGTVGTTMSNALFVASNGTDYPTYKYGNSGGGGDA